MQKQQTVKDSHLYTLTNWGIDPPRMAPSLLRSYRGSRYTQEILGQSEQLRQNLTVLSPKADGVPVALPIWLIHIALDLRINGGHAAAAAISSSGSP